MRLIYHVNLNYCTVHKNTISPTFYVLTNEVTESHIIIHCHDWSELTAENISSVTLDDYDLLYFESRSIPTLKSMLPH